MVLAPWNTGLLLLPLAFRSLLSFARMALAIEAGRRLHLARGLWSQFRRARIRSDWWRPARWLVVLVKLGRRRFRFVADVRLVGGNQPAAGRFGSGQGWRIPQATDSPTCPPNTARCRTNLTSTTSPSARTSRKKDT